MYRVNDRPDPTPNEWGDMCKVRIPNVLEDGRSGGGTWVCTWRKDSARHPHPDLHVAGNGARICAVWNVTSEDSEDGHDL